MNGNFIRIIEMMSEIPDVKEAVIKNYINNLWWPTDTWDWRMRLIIAGLSTRISYNMIRHYRTIITPLTLMSYEDFCQLSSSELTEQLKGLGMVNNRLKYVSSMCALINDYGNDLLEYGNDQLIELIQSKVIGASYKVGQCCALYMKGYHCGIMPVDSGMKDVLAPCLGFSHQKGAYGHEELRNQFEKLVTDNSLALKDIMYKSYKELGLVDVPSWWVHLVMIYYKRHFCNKKKAELCPIHINQLNIVPYCI